MQRIPNRASMYAVHSPSLHQISHASSQSGEANDGKCKLGQSVGSIGHGRHRVEAKHMGTSHFQCMSEFSTNLASSQSGEANDGKCSLHSQWVAESMVVIDLHPGRSRTRVHPGIAPTHASSIQNLTFHQNRVTQGVNIVSHGNGPSLSKISTTGSSSSSSPGLSSPTQHRAETARGLAFGVLFSHN